MDKSERLLDQKIRILAFIGWAITLCVLAIASIEMASGSMPYWNSSLNNDLWAYWNLDGFVVGEDVVPVYWSGGSTYLPYFTFDTATNVFSTQVDAVINTGINMTNMTNDSFQWYFNTPTNAVTEENITICLWVNINNQTLVPLKHYTLFEMQDLVYGTNLYSIYYDDDFNLSFAIEYDPTAFGIVTDYKIIETNYSLIPGQWYFICGVKIKNETELYINGVNQTNINRNDFGSISSGYNMRYLTIGANPGSIYSEYQPPAIIDEIGLWGSGYLSSSQITDLYNLGIGWTWINPIVETNIYNNESWELVNETIQLNLLLDAVLYGNTSAVLVWDGTEYESEITEIVINSSYINVTYTANVVMPEITGSSETKNFYWNVTMTWPWQPDTYYVSDTQSQTIYLFDLDGCENNVNQVLNFSFFNEELPNTALANSYEVVIEYWLYSNPSAIKYYNGSDASEVDSFGICINQSDITSNIYVKYTNSDSFTHRYFLNQYNLTVGTVYNHSLYNFVNTTDKSDLKMTIRYNANYNYYPNIYTKLLRFYPGSNTWKLVQMDRSGDFGLVNFHIWEQKTDYKLIFQDEDNNILKTTNILTFRCDAGLCEQIVLLDPYSAVSGQDAVSVRHSFDNNSKVLTVEWTNDVGGSSSVYLWVSKETMTGSLNICTQNQTGAAGTMTCNLSAYSGQFYMTIASESSDRVAEISEWIQIPLEKLRDKLDSKDGALWGFLLMLTIVCFGLVSPGLAIGVTIFGLIALSFFGLLSFINITFIIIAISGGLVIALKVRR